MSVVLLRAAGVQVNAAAALCYLCRERRSAVQLGKRGALEVLQVGCMWMCLVAALPHVNKHAGCVRRAAWVHGTTGFTSALTAVRALTVLPLSGTGMTTSKPCAAVPSAARQRSPAPPAPSARLKVIVGDAAEASGGGNAGSGGDGDGDGPDAPPAVTGPGAPSSRLRHNASRWVAQRLTAAA